MTALSRIVHELFRSAGDGSVSLSKTMKMIGFIVVTYIVLLQAHRGTLTVEIFLAYFGLVIGNDQTGKWLSIKREKIQLDSANPGDTSNDKPNQ